MQPYRSFFFFFHIIIILSTTLFTFPIAARDTITPTQPLADNETLVSSDGSFALGFFTPSATTSRYVGIWYNKIPSRDIVWVANRGNPVIDSAGQLSVAANGTLIVTDQKSTAVVCSAAGDPTAGLVSPVAQLLDTGNFVVKGGDGGNGSYAWQGFDHPTDTLLPGMKLGVDRITGLNRTLRVWKSNNDPSPASTNGRSIWSRISWPLALTAMYVGLVSFTIYLTCVIRRYWSRRKRRRRELQYANSFRNEQSDEGANYFDLPIMDFATIEAATDNFSSTNKLGQGGYGPVYKGILGDSREIAVKRLAKTSLQGSEEFKNEVILIAKLQNRNLVQLLGCCIERKERMLIYEYMVNKSLDSFLFEKHISPFDWQTRYRIILGITRGLLYLHHDSRLRIIHRDLKASNILLDKDMNPKISDFGMARILAGDETNINTKKVVGTYGYMSPEYALDGIFSLKSDVYSFGVLVLEIISGKKNRGSSPFSPQLNLVSHAWSLWIERKALELVDESMNYTVAVNEVLNCIKVGLLCVQECPEDRPLMSSVILMLGSDIATLPEPKQPGFVTRLSPPEVDEPVDKHILYVSNNLTSSLTGR